MNSIPYCVPIVNHWQYQKEAKEWVDDWSENTTTKESIHTGYAEDECRDIQTRYKVGAALQVLIGLVAAVALTYFGTSLLTSGTVAAVFALNALYSLHRSKVDLVDISRVPLPTNEDKLSPIQLLLAANNFRDAWSQRQSLPISLRQTTEQQVVAKVKERLGAVRANNNLEETYTFVREHMDILPSDDVRKLRDELELEAIESIEPGKYKLCLKEAFFLADSLSKNLFVLIAQKKGAAAVVQWIDENKDTPTGKKLIGLWGEKFVDLFILPQHDYVKAREIYALCTRSDFITTHEKLHKTMEEVFALPNHEERIAKIQECLKLFHEGRNPGSYPRPITKEIIDTIFAKPDFPFLRRVFHSLHNFLRYDHYDVEWANLAKRVEGIAGAEEAQKFRDGYK